MKKTKLLKHLSDPHLQSWLDEASHFSRVSTCRCSGSCRLSSEKFMFVSVSRITHKLVDQSSWSLLEGSAESGKESLKLSYIGLFNLFLALLVTLFNNFHRYSNSCMSDLLVFSFFPSCTDPRPAVSPCGPSPWSMEDPCWGLREPPAAHTEIKLIYNSARGSSAVERRRKTHLR